MGTNASLQPGKLDSISLQGWRGRLSKLGCCRELPHGRCIQSPADHCAPGLQSAHSLSCTVLQISKQRLWRGAVAPQCRKMVEFQHFVFRLLQASTMVQYEALERLRPKLPASAGDNSLPCLAAIQQPAAAFHLKRNRAAIIVQASSRISRRTVERAS